MSKFLDYSGLENKIYKKAYRLADVKDQLETVAFYIVKFKYSDKGAELWQVQSADDGEYIVALYQPEEVEKEGSNNWSVIVTTASSSLQISYKGDPIMKIAASKLGFPVEELHKVPQYLPMKLSENKKLVKALLNSLTPSAKKEVLNKYPELV